MTEPNLIRLKKLIRYLKDVACEADGNLGGTYLHQVIWDAALELEEIHDAEDLPWER